MARAVLVAVCIFSLVFSSPAARIAQRSPPRAASVGDLAAWADLESITEAAQKLFDTAKTLQDIKQKWEALIKALSEGTRAAQAAVAGGEALGAKVVKVSSTIDNLGLLPLMDGEISLSDIKGINSLYDQPKDVRNIIKQALSSGDEMSHLCRAVESLVTMLERIQDLIESAEKLAPALEGVGQGVLPALMSRVEAVHMKLDVAVEELTSTDALLGPLLEEIEPGFLNYASTGFHLASNYEEIKSGFTNLDVMWKRVTNLQAEVMPLLQDLFNQVKSIQEASSRYQLPTPSPEGPASGSSETISRSKCSERTIGRVFKEDANVDANMACTSIPFVGQQYCTCARAGDCYVESEDRPEPANLKRCFTPVG